MEMLHLRYFVAVAEELNYSAAARRLHMATSPLSQRGAIRERGKDDETFRAAAGMVRSAPQQWESTVRVPSQADVRDVGTESSTRPPQRIPAPR